MTADQFGAITGKLLPTGCLVPPPCSYPAPAFGTWPAGAACLVTVCFPPADGLHSVVLYIPCAVHPVPSAWVSH